MLQERLVLRKKQGVVCGEKEVEACTSASKNIDYISCEEAQVGDCMLLWFHIFS